MSAGYPLTEWEVNQHGFDQFPPSAQVKTCPHCDVRFVDTNPLSVGPALRLAAHIEEQHTVKPHTPTPWVFDGVRVGPAIGSDGKYVLMADVVAIVYGTNGQVARGDGEFIVRAVNSHEALVGALTTADVEQIIEAIENFVMGPVEDPELDAIWLPYIGKLNALRAALALAEGRA